MAGCSDATWPAKVARRFVPLWEYRMRNRPWEISDLEHRKRSNSGWACCWHRKSHLGAHSLIPLLVRQSLKVKKTVCTWTFMHRRLVKAPLEHIPTTFLSHTLFFKLGNRTDKLPVLVWIHGGGWISGHGGISDFGPDYFLEHDVVLVTGNYRLGPLGFLSTEDKECSGNFGLKDQVTMLKWVRMNIDKFGGESSSVTIFGNSAGRTIFTGAGGKQTLKFIFRISLCKLPHDISDVEGAVWQSNFAIWNFNELLVRQRLTTCVRCLGTVWALSLTQSH